MVFICLNMTLEDFLKKDKKTRMSEVNWLLFDKHIKDKSLANKNNLFGDGNSGNLSAYIDRIFFYPFYYKEPLHLYLMTNKKFSTIDFLPDDENYKNTACIWNMKQIPEPWNKEKYPRLSDEEMLWGTGTYEEHKNFLREKFKELILCKDDISHICIGE